SRSRTAWLMKMLVIGLEGFDLSRESKPNEGNVNKYRRSDWGMLSSIHLQPLPVNKRPTRIAPIAKKSRCRYNCLNYETITSNHHASAPPRLSHRARRGYGSGKPASRTPRWRPGRLRRGNLVQLLWRERGRHDGRPGSGAGDNRKLAGARSG